MDRDLLKATVFSLIEICKETARDGYELVITGHDMPDCDSIISAVMLRELLLRLGINSDVKFGTRPDGVTERLVRELDILGNVSFEGFENSERLVLVDHHATFYNNKVIACIDHHTTPPKPDFAVNFVRQASSCGKIIFDMAVASDVSDDWMEKMAIYSVYLDTQSCLAPKFEKNDMLWLADGISRLGLDEKALVQKGFCLNSLEEDTSILAMYAYKKYEFGGQLGASTCIQIDSEEKGWNKKIEEILAFLNVKMEEDSTLIWALVVNMPKNMRSDIYFICEDGVELRKLERLASRSKDVVPVVKEHLENKR